MATATLMERQPKVPVRINRKPPRPVLQPFTDYFQGFENVGAVREVFGETTDAVLERLKVGFISNRRMYMGIRDQDGNMGVGTYHLKHSDLRILYLDIVHELFHVKQFMENRKYFREEHQKFMQDRSLYYVSPIEVPAYKHTVKEAKRIGMSYDEIADYLKMGPVDPKVFGKFLERMELEQEGGGTSPAVQVELPVRINRNPSLTLFPFTDYFKGFEKVAAVKAIFGDGTEEVLRNLKVEFHDSPFRTIFPSDEDGHLLVSVDYVRKADVKSVYLAVFLCLNLLKHFLSEEKPLLDSRDEQELNSNPAIFESYKSMVKEAKRMGMSNDRIMEHLQLLRFLMPPTSYGEFVRKLGLLV
jgi:hypothetical protein